MNDIIYLVYDSNSNVIPDEFGNEGWDSLEDAIAFAKDYLDEDPYVMQVEVTKDDDGIIVDAREVEEVWSSDSMNEFADAENTVVDSNEYFSSEDETNNSYSYNDFDDFYVDFADTDIDEEYEDCEDKCEDCDESIKEKSDNSVFDDILTGLKEALEENEDEVECESCLELVPKCDCKKTDSGYICKACEEEHSSHEGTALDLIDADTSDI